MSKRRYVIAIDGPAGSGKSTTARLVAEKLHFTYLDTGALYRALTLLAIQKGVNLDDGKALSRLLSSLSFRIATEKDRLRVWVDDHEVTEAIRGPEISRNVSRVARHEDVRREMVALQRKLAQSGNLVVEGRDIGTVVFPDADLKIFLTASVTERARRRQKELQSKGHSISLETVVKDLQERDRLDRERQVAPLRQAPDAVLIDTTHLSIEEQVNRIVELFHQRVQPAETLGQQEN